MLRDASLSEEQLSRAGSRMAYLRWNQGAMEAERLGRSGAMRGLGYLAIGSSGVLNAIGYHSQGYGWGASVAKSVVVTGFSAAGAFGGAVAGGFGGALVPGFDLTGIPEVAGAVAGAVGGGWLGGEIGSFVAGFIPNF
jgi:hypothetical protein